MELNKTPAECAVERVVAIPLEKQILLHLIFCHPGEKGCTLSNIITLLEGVHAHLSISRESYDKNSVLQEIIGSLSYIGLEDNSGGEGYIRLGDDPDIREITNSLRKVGSEDNVDGKELYTMWCDEDSASTGQRRSRHGKETNSSQWVMIDRVVRRCMPESLCSYQVC